MREVVQRAKRAMNYAPRMTDTPLAAYVRRVARDKGLSDAMVAARATRRGKALSKGTMSTLKSGKTTKHALSTLDGIAAGLDEPLVYVLLAAAGYEITEDKKGAEMRAIALSNALPSKVLHDWLAIGETLLANHDPTQTHTNKPTKRK